MNNNTTQYNKNTTSGVLGLGNDNDRMQWYYFIILVFLIKLTIYFFDSTPMFFLGDSQVYLTTAINGLIPTDRSFVYGFIIRLIAGASHSLQNLILFQTLLGGVAAIIAAYILWEFFAVPQKVAFIAGLFCAVEPLQLFYERYALTETVTIFVFALYTLIVFCYLRRPGLLYIFILQLIGLVLISLRMSYLPLILVVTILLPFLGAWVVWSRHYGDGVLKWAVCGSLLLHLIFSISSMSILHYSYKYLLGSLVDRPPAYRYEDGVTLLTCWSPIIEPEDFPDKKFGKEVFSRLTIDPKQRKRRAAQRCWDGGLTHVIWELIGKTEAADHVAKQTALRAAKRDPMGLFRLYIYGFNDYWNVGFLKGLMRLDRGCVNHPYPKQFLDFLRTNFTFASAPHPCSDTMTGRYFNWGWPWYLFLLLTPLFSLPLIYYFKGVSCPYAVVLFLFSSFLVTIPATFPDVRYIHPLGWFVFIVFPPLVTKIIEQLSKVKIKS